MKLSVIDDEKLDQLPSHERMANADDRRRKYDKMFDNHLRRFLISRVGKHWDRVISEFLHADWVPPTKCSLQTLQDKVECHTYFVGKDIYYYDNWGFYRNRFGETGRAIKEETLETFYIHPKSRVLCYKPRERRINYRERYAAEEARTMRVLGDYKQLLKLGGIWYYVWADISNPRIWAFRHPHSRLITEGEHKVPDFYYKWLDLKKAGKATDADYHEACFPKIFKRQLNKGELRIHNLTNDVVLSSGKRCPVCGGTDCRLRHHLAA